MSEIICLEGYIQSIYLVVYPDKLLLLDGGCRADIPMIVNYIQTILKRPISDLKVVMVTHMHPDHAGGAHMLRRLTGCQVVSADKPKQWYHSVGGQLMHLIDTGLAHYVAKRQNRPFKCLWYPAHLQTDSTVQDGDHIPNFADWQVLETSGHTDRDLSLLHLPTRQIYIADLIIKLRHKFVAPFPIYDPIAYRRSLQNVKELQPSKVLLAHGGALVIDEVTFDALIEQAPKQRRTVKATIYHKLSWKLYKTR